MQSRFLPVHLNQYTNAISTESAPLQHLVESRDKGLCKPETEDELGAGHEQLRSKTFEEGRKSLVLGHVRHNPESRLLGLEVAVLNTSLDDIERGGDDQRGRGTGDGGDEVLGPGGGVVVAQAVEVLLGCGTATEELWSLSVMQSKGAESTGNVRRKNLARCEQQSSPILYKDRNPHRQRSS